MLENNWTISTSDQYNKKYYHYYLCKCSAKFTCMNDIHEIQAPDVVCSHCGNNYFKDTHEVYSMQKTKIWKDFHYSTILQENNYEWIVAFEYDIPLYDEAKNDIILKTERLLSISLQRDGYGGCQITYDTKIMQKYSLFKNEQEQALKKFLLNEAKEKLYNFILKKQYAQDTYVILYSENLLEVLQEKIMLDSLVHKHREKSIKKALHQSYVNSINQLGFYPYIDYIFSSTIRNIDLLRQFLTISPLQKNSIFTTDNYAVGIDFLYFLKGYYTEGQLVKFFIHDLQNIEERRYWQDTLQMLQTKNTVQNWQNYFLKVKLTPKKLHDEIIRVFHIISYESQNKEKFEYQKKYIYACKTYQGFQFQLPQTVAELSLWSKLLHNCMFGYSQKIHQQSSVIYGVFQNDDLLYAVELRKTCIVQAKANFNHSISGKHRIIIQDWWKENFNYEIDEKMKKKGA